MEVDGHSLHPSIVSVSGIIHIAFIDLKEKKRRYSFYHMCKLTVCYIKFSSVDE